MSDHFDLLEMDDPTSKRAPAADGDSEPIMLDLVDDPRHPTCLTCGLARPVDDRSICRECAAGTAPADDFGGAPEELAPHGLAEIAAESTQNAAVVGAAAADGAGPLPGVGFRSQEGYIAAIRNGVKAETHREYLRVLRDTYKLSQTAIAKLALPGPLVEVDLPVGAGIKHVPTGPSVFDRPKAARAFVVGPKEAPGERLDVTLQSKDLVAGAVAEGHHAIIAWEGTSGTTRGELVEALTAIGRDSWAPRAPNARAQAGAAIMALSRSGLVVKPLHKGAQATDLAAGDHVWTVGKVGHASAIGDHYGQIVCRFKLSGSVLSYQGSAELGEPVVAAYNARIASELFKSSDVTSWLSRTLRWQLDAVRFGALGWLVPARHVAAATQLVTVVRGAGFGTGWVTGLPVATSDQLRDGIVRGLVAEVDEVTNALRAARSEAKADREAKIRAAEAAHDAAARNQAAMLPGDIGQARAGTFLKELRAIGGRVVAYGQVLGESRVDRAQRTIREAMAELEGILGDDYSGIRERFALIWDEIEADRRKTGGVL